MGRPDAPVDGMWPDGVQDADNPPCDGPILTWRVHLLRSDPAKLMIVAPILIGSLAICYATFHSMFYAAVVIVLFAIALSDYILPVRYEITEKGASARTAFSQSRVEWDAVKKYYVDKSGIKLSPFENHTRLEAYRGVYLRFGNYRDEVTAAVRRMRDARSADRSV